MKSTRNITLHSLAVRSLKTIIPMASFLFAASLADAKISIGDPAPQLQTGKWVQGEPVTQFATNRVYVVEFWATWCGPCRVSIPHLNELWQKFKDKGVIVIGQDVWDSDDAVAPFVKSMGDKMTYRVALDDKKQSADGFMASHWWKRGVEGHGIPNAFIINKQGRIAWIGHPMGLNEKVLDDIAADRYDLAQAKAQYDKEEQDQAQWEAANDKVSNAIAQKRWAEAGSALDDVLKLAEALKFPKPVGGYADGFAPMRLQILLGQKSYDDAYGLVESFSERHSKDSDRQNTLAWILITTQGIEPRGISVARKLAERANVAAGEKNPAILDTLARALFMSEEKSEAIKIQQKALDAAPERDKSRYRKSLDDYKQGKLPAAAFPGS
jgi:thiol-disulfide isomerase/thioredoxin